jgi:DNA-binding transcriptional LysR family regulator
MRHGNLDDLRAFVIVARKRSFTKAAGVIPTTTNSVVAVLRRRHRESSGRSRRDELADL